MRYLIVLLFLLPFTVSAQMVSLGAAGGYSFMGNPGFVSKFGESGLNSYYVSGTLAIKLGKKKMWEVGECASMLRVSTRVVTNDTLYGQKGRYKGNRFTAHYANPLFSFSFFFNKSFRINSFNEKPVQKIYAGLHLGLLLSENALAKTDSTQAKMYNDAKGFNAGIQLGYMLEVSPTVSFTLESTPGYYLIKYTGGTLNNTDFKSAIINFPFSLGVRVNI